MTRVTESLSTQLPDSFDHARARVEETFDDTAAYLEETATRIKESDAADNARRIAAVVATSLARGAGQVGVFLGRQSAAVAKKGVAKAKQLPNRSAERVEKTAKPRGRKRVVLFLIAGAAVAGGAVFFKNRRSEHPPVAPAPPRVEEKPADKAEEKS
ncbi:hypothetical protein ABH922_004744 [Rhodococcus sp. 27YEA15]|uniref:hypothetical protein n=1 Tax=Rhodococcus sp. 27YEA15 TaxID=3156259 RepID=UPI003C7D4850